MPKKTISRNMLSGLAGAAVWAGVAVLAGTHHAPFGIIELMFLFAPLVIVPLGLELSGTLVPTGRTLSRLASQLQPLAAALVVVAFWLPPGRWAAALSLPWACVCGLVALGSASTLLRRQDFSLPSILAHIGRFDLVIGAAWLLMSRMGMRPQGFQEPIILLTAVHFHYSGFGLATIAAATVQTARLRSWRSSTLGPCAALVVFLPFLLAAGFVFSPALKVGSAVVLALSVITLATMLFRLSFRLVSWTARFYQRVGSAFVLIGMVLAMVYAVGDYVSRDWLVIPRMASTHGVWNGLGFILLSLLGWLAEFHDSAADGRRDSLKSEDALPSRVAQRRSATTQARLVELNCKNLIFAARDFYDR